MNVTDSHHVQGSTNDYIAKTTPHNGDKPFTVQMPQPGEEAQIKPVPETGGLLGLVDHSDNSYTASVAYQQVDEQREDEENAEGKSNWLEEDKDEEEEDKKEVLIDIFLKALENKDAKADMSQTEEEKGVENFAIQYEMSKKINGEFAGRLMTGDALNVPRTTYWIN